MATMFTRFPTMSSDARSIVGNLNVEDYVMALGQDSSSECEECPDLSFNASLQPYQQYVKSLQARQQFRKSLFNPRFIKP